jgi:FAD:protein FMN transferase
VQKLLIFTVLASFFTSGLSSLWKRAERFEYSEVHMGTLFRVTFITEEKELAESAARAVFARIRELDQMLSDYRQDSELMALRRRAAGSPVKVSPELYYVIETSQQLAIGTGGAFDITIGPLSRIWRRARRQRQMPGRDEIKAALKLTGYKKIVLEQNTVTLTTPGMVLDLGGIAKGYAADEALAVLRSRKITGALVAAGGDIVAGDSPDSKFWRIGIQPLSNNSKELFCLSNMAVSTSGDVEQFVLLGGRRYSHIVDPRTGYPITDSRSVTVLAPKGILSDSLATALYVLGKREGRRFIESTKGAGAIFFDGNRDGEYSRGMDWNLFRRRCQ